MKKKKGMYKEGSHTDAVMCLNLHPLQHNVLASGSADTLVKVWDIASEKCVHNIKLHTDRVQTVKWNPVNNDLLFTGSYDHTIAIFDARSPKEPMSAKHYAKKDIESACWNPWESN
jgi:periodic tryptophan protein 1